MPTKKILKAISKSNDSESPTNDQLLRIEELKSRRKKLIANIIKPVRILPYMGIPLLANHYLLGPGKLLQDSFLRIFEEYSLTVTSTNLEHLTRIDAIRQKAIDGILSFIASFPVRHAIDPMENIGIEASLLDQDNFISEELRKKIKLLFSNHFFILSSHLSDQPDFEKYFLSRVMGDAVSLGVEQVSENRIRTLQLRQGVMTPDYSQMYNKTLSEIVSLIKEAYFRLLQRMKETENNQEKLHAAIKTTSLITAFIFTDYVFMVAFVMSTIAARYFLDPKMDVIFNPVVEKLDKFAKVSDETSNPASRQCADNMINALEIRNNQLLKAYRGTTVFMAVFIGAAMLYSFDRLYNKKEESPALYIFILSTLSNLIFDFLNLRQFYSEMRASSSRKNDVKKIHSYFNDAVASTQTEWILVSNVLTFAADKKNHSTPRKINEVVKKVLEKNNIPVVSENNGDLLIIKNPKLPIVNSSEINSEIMEKINALKTSSEEKLPPSLPSLTKNKPKLPKGEKRLGLFESKEKLIKKAEREITLPEDLVGRGNCVVRANGTIIFIWNPNEYKESEVTQDEIVALVGGDNLYRIARCKGQPGIKRCTDGIVYYKNPNTPERILLDKAGKVTVKVDGEDREVDAFYPSEKGRKDVLRRNRR